MELALLRGVARELEGVWVEEEVAAAGWEEQELELVGTVFALAVEQPSPQTSSPFAMTSIAPTVAQVW